MIPVSLKLKKMCHCEEGRRSNLLNGIRFLSLNLDKINLFFLIINLYLTNGIGSNLADCFVVPPRNDTFF
jgi:hypothetical protein